MNGHGGNRIYCRCLLRSSEGVEMSLDAARTSAPQRTSKGSGRRRVTVRR
jgi:hypothetical protein